MRAFVEQFPFASGRASLAPPFPDYVEEIVLAADAPAAVPLPAGARYVVLSFSGDVRVKLGTGGTVVGSGAASTGDGSGAEWNPAARRIPATLADGATVPTHLCLRAPAACRGSLAFYG